MKRKQVVVMAAAACIAAALMACRDSSAAGTGEDISYRARPGYVIDSVRPIEVELDRFRKNLGPPPAELSGGARSFDALVQSFGRAVQGRDTSAMLRMQLDAREFAWLVYPSSPYTKPPYLQTPQFVWKELRNGDVGLYRLLARRGGSDLRIIGRSCDPEPAVEGENRLWRHCAVQTIDGGETVSERLFGVVIERHGRFKFASYQNQY